MDIKRELSSISKKTTYKKDICIYYSASPDIDYIRTYEEAFINNKQISIITDIDKAILAILQKK